MTTANSAVKIGNVTFSNSAPLALIAGPCQMESREHAFDMAGRLVEITNKLGMGLVISRALTRRTAPRLARSAALVWKRRSKFLPISRKNSVFLF